MTNVEKFLESKQYLNEECIKVARMADEKSWLTRKIVTYVTENYVGIDQFIVLWVVMNHHWTNENRSDITDAMDELFNETIERWVNPSPYRDEDKFIVGAIATILSIPTKY
jgi:hypothetical protein